MAISIICFTFLLCKDFIMCRLLTILTFLLFVSVGASAQTRDFNVFEERVLEAYLAFYGRPADPGGLAFWSDRLEQEGGDLTSIINAFGESKEYTDRFGNLSNTELVTNIYDQLFGRAPDTGGLDFYVNQLVTGARNLQQISIVVLDGVQGNDVTIVANRLALSARYVSAVEAGSTEAKSADDLASIIASIDGEPASLTGAICLIEDCEGGGPDVTTGSQTAISKGATWSYWDMGQEPDAGWKRAS
ncbi:MAG: hypothetical protein ACI9WS_001891, partial [Paraglaciecola psychrophila]